MIRSFTLCLAVSAAIQAQDSRAVIDNDQVRVLKVTVQPHQKTRAHDHKVNRVMIYFQAGHQNLDYQDGRKVLQNWKPGEVKWSPASGMHVAEITSDQPVTIVEVELKKPGNPSKAAATALDPVKVDPKHYKVEFENDQVRVLRVRIGPREKAPMHEHALNRVVAYLTDQSIRVTSADGKVDEPKHRAGDVAGAGQAKHKEENLNRTAFEVVVVELKS